MRGKLLKFVLVFQGLYYSITGFWAIVALDHFSRFTGLHPEALDAVGRFEMHSIAAMSLIIGLFFLWSSRKEELSRPAGYLALGFVLAVIIPELIYLPKIGNPILFWVDFAEESIVGLLLAYTLIFKK